VLGAKPPAESAVDAKALSALLAGGRATVIDLSRSPAYRKGHIPGAWFAIRARLKETLSKIRPEIAAQGELVLTSEDGVLAGLAVRESPVPARYLQGGNAAWVAAGLPLSDEPRMADEPLDHWPKPYERAGDTKGAMNEYLAWEVDLLPRTARDGTARFTP
jgi:3-mercaptopyruvate sulfurtransferase SseA